MKNIFILFTFLFVTSNLFGAYNIKIAVYKNHANLMEYMKNIPGEAYRTNIHIEKKNNLYYVTSTIYESENDVKKALHAYKKCFPDAFIQKVAVENTKMMKAEHIMEQEVLNAKKLLANKTVYVCNEHHDTTSKKEVVKLTFKKDYVLYSKLRRDIPPIKLPYTFDKKSILLSISRINFRYKIEDENKNYLSVQSFVNEKKGRKLRYYFDEILALKFTKHH